MRIPNKYNGYSADNRRLYYDPVTLAAMAASASAAAPAAATALTAAEAAAAATAAAAAAAPVAAAAVPLAATAAVPAAASAAIPGLVSSAAPALAGQAATVAAPSAIPGLIGGASPVFSAAANPLTEAMATGANGFPLTPGGVAPMQPSYWDQFTKFTQQNPTLTQMGFSTGKDLLTPDQVSPAPIIPVQPRGQLKPYDPMASMNPYQQTVISGQPISLLG
jgi:hypothetical protein